MAKLPFAIVKDTRPKDAYAERLARIVAQHPTLVRAIEAPPAEVKSFGKRRTKHEQVQLHRPRHQ